jgi:hypothetical protein
MEITKKKNNKGNIDISSITSAIERKMLEYMATQIQTLQAMTQTKGNIHQYIIEQASNPSNPNLVLGETIGFQLFHRHRIKKIYQSCKLKSYKDGSRLARHPPHNTEITKAGVPARPVMKQVVEVWNHQNNQRSHGAPELRTNEQQEHMKTTRTSQCCEHYGRSCLQKEASLMTDEARQCYHLNINKKSKLCTQNPVLKKNKLLKL